MTGYRIKQIDFSRRNVMRAAGALVGLLAGLACALLTTRHLTLAEDPMGLVGAWACFLAVCPILGGALGAMAADSLTRRAAGRAAGTAPGRATPEGQGQRAA